MILGPSGDMVVQQGVGSCSGVVWLFRWEKHLHPGFSSWIQQLYSIAFGSPGG